jgi:hypothetical protein
MLMDLIYAARYTEVCDYAWHDYNDINASLPEGIWHVDTASIPEFFSTIQNMFNRNRRYVVVSPSCDFGVCLQRYNHPALDLEKWTGLNMTPQAGYQDLHMQARVNRNRCNPNDVYSIKCWSYTEATFNTIPDNVAKWFLGNCDIDHPKVIAIPFGIFGNKDKLETANAIDTYFDAGRLTACGATIPERNKLLYVNFSFYTTDRYRLYKHFNNYFGDLVTCEQGVDFDHFLSQLASHKFVLCPPGNGADCYRTLEALYMGAVPVLENRMGCLAPYVSGGYPLVVYPNLFMCTPEGLNALDIANEWDLTKVSWPYWKNRILTA